MCGRYALALSNEELYDGLQQRLPRVFQGNRPNWEREQDYRPNYNVAPRQRAPIVHRQHDSEDVVMETMQWGLIPHWTKHPPKGAMNTINARSEGLLDASSGGMWHALKGHKRCIVPAQGYYEWHKRPSAKIAHFTRLPLGTKDTNATPPLMFFAGLYDVVKYLSPVESKFQAREGDDREPYPTGNPLPLATFTILTTIPAKDLEWLHDRMPCVLTEEEDIIRWLDLGEVKGWEEGKGGTGELLMSTPGLDCFPVNPEVGKIGTNSPTYIQPVSERSDGIKSFFSKQQPSPAKKPVKEGKPTKGVKDEKPSKVGLDVKQEAEGIKTEIGKEDPEPGIGDDSNAPNEKKPQTTEQEVKKETKPETPGKRKREPDAEEPEDGERRGGHQTKVVRKSVDEGNKEQPSITSFFKSPNTKSEPKEPPKGRPGTRSRKK